MARRGLKTLIVRMAVKFKFSTCITYSSRPAKTIKKSKRFHESAKYVVLPYIPIATILMHISKAKKANMISSNVFKDACRGDKTGIWIKYYMYIKDKVERNVR